METMKTGSMAYLFMKKAGKFFGYQGKWKAGTTEHELTKPILCESQCTKLKSMIVQFWQPTSSIQLSNIYFLFLNWDISSIVENKSELSILTSMSVST